MCVWGGFGGFSELFGDFRDFASFSDFPETRKVRKRNMIFNWGSVDSLNTTDFTDQISVGLSQISALRVHLLKIRYKL